jgi:hypothetical protein
MVCGRVWIVSAARWFIVHSRRVLMVSTRWDRACWRHSHSYGAITWRAATP